nr:hypothetical protein [Fusobacterium varium]
MKFSYVDEGKGEVLVFVHSYLWDKEMWKPQVEELKKILDVLQLIFQIMENQKILMKVFH